MRLTNKAAVFVGFMALCAVGVVIYAAKAAHFVADYRFYSLLILSVATARLKVKLPGLNGNMAVNLPFLLLAVTQLSLLGALLIALPACGAQCFPANRHKPKPVQMVFNLSTTTVAMGMANLTGVRYIAMAAATLFLAQTLPVASIIALTEGGAVARIWSSIAHSSFPFYVLSAGMSAFALAAKPEFSWQILVLCLPVLYAIYRSYRSYLREPQPIQG